MQGAGIRLDYYTNKKRKEVEKMGMFSWIYSDTKKRLINNREKDSYLLVPPPFQKKYGKYIHESCYDGYGHFGRYDVYNLIPEWNKEMIPEIIQRIKDHRWRCSTTKYGLENLQKFYDGEKIYGLFNFSEYDKTAWINGNDGLYVDLISGQKMKACGVNIPAFGYYYLKKL